MKAIFQQYFSNALFFCLPFYHVDKLWLGMNTLKENSNKGNICDVTYGSFMSLDTFDGMLKYDYRICTYVGK